MRIEASSIVLTGASGGIGSAVARALAPHAVRLLLCGRDRVVLERLAEDVRAAGSEARVAALDLDEPDSAQRLVDEGVAAFGQIDLLINCAGVSHFGLFEQTPDADLERMLRVNLLAPMRLMQAAVPHFRGRRRGLIVNVGSIFGSIAFPCFAAYSATKFALRGLSEALRRELADSGVGVLYFAPRYTRTALNAGSVSEMASAVAMNKDDPERVAEALVRALERDLAERYLGWPEKLFVRINAWFPRLVDAALRRQTRQMLPYALHSSA
jgi:short-subunit dehydrogenase